MALQLLEGRDLKALTREERETLQRRVGIAISTGLSREEVALRLNLTPPQVASLIKSKSARAAMKVARSASESLVSVDNALSAQEFVDDARNNHEIAQQIRDTAYPTTQEAHDRAAALGINPNPQLAQTIAFKLLALAGHSPVHKSEQTHKLEIHPDDAALLRDALTEARQNRGSSIIDVEATYSPLDSSD